MTIEAEPVQEPEAPAEPEPEFAAATMAASDPVAEEPAAAPAAARTELAGGASPSQHRPQWKPSRSRGRSQSPRSSRSPNPRRSPSPSRSKRLRLRPIPSPRSRAAAPAAAGLIGWWRKPSQPAPTEVEAEPEPGPEPEPEVEPESQPEGRSPESQPVEEVAAETAAASVAAAGLVGWWREPKSTPKQREPKPQSEPMPEPLSEPTDGVGRLGGARRPKSVAASEPTCPILPPELAAEDSAPSAGAAATMTAPVSFSEATFAVGGMSCASCSAIIEKVLGKTAGVDSAVVNLATERLSVTYDADVIDAGWHRGDDRPTSATARRYLAGRRRPPRRQAG